MSDEEISQIAAFNNFSTYFSNFESARENIYSSGISNSVAYRVVVDNFGKFYSNIILFGRINDSVKQEISVCFDTGYLFSVDSYNHILSQKNIDTYNEIIKEINKICNERYQDKTLSHKTKFTPLFKQILTESEKLFEAEPFENKEELLKAVHDYDKFLSETVERDFNEIKQIFNDKKININNIFVDKNQITVLSKLIYDDWSKIKNTLEKSDYYSIAQIQSEFDDCNIMEMIVNKLECAINNISNNRSFLPCNSIDGYEETKKYMDSVQQAEKILKIISSDKPEKDELFYAYFDSFYDAFRCNIPLYNKIRNYATKKQYSTEKVKLYFDIKNGNFLNGWVESKTEDSDNGTQYGGYLFRKKNSIGEYDYYLGVSNNKKLFRYETEVKVDDYSEYERLNYYQPKSQTVYGAAYKGQNSYDNDKELLIDIIKNNIENSEREELIEEFSLMFSNTDKEITPIKCIETIKSKYPDYLPLLIENKEFNRMNRLVIDNIKKTINSMKRLKNTDIIIEKNYNLFTEIMADVDELMTQRVLYYAPVSKNELNDAVNSTQKPLLLFKISNKDLSFAESFSEGKRKSRGSENLHTIYFKELMSADNSPIDIGSGSVFFRKRSVEYSNEILEKGHHYNELKDKFSYPIIKDKRYVYDQFQFHLSAVFNYKMPQKPNNFNRSVLKTLQDAEDYNIIGLDRGERNLLYASVIDKSGNILCQKSLNVLNGIDYHKKLEELEIARLDERKNWESISKIKDLKVGYISHAVRFIVDLMLKYNAVVALEDLSYDFKRIRIHIEKQVYQNFEKALIEKLNFLVLKDREKDEPGGVRKAYQLTEKFETFQKLGKQSGFLFYVPPAYTSKIDPISGFVNLFDSKYLSYSSKVKSKEFISKFDNIIFDDITESFRFDFDYRNFNTHRSDFTNKWSVYSYGEDRIVSCKKNNFTQYNTVNATQYIKELLEFYGIDYKSSSLKEDICKINEESFFRSFLWIFKTIVQLRYENKENDFILSPVMVNGKFFDSRVADTNQPENGDSNGAYHIALQGLRLLTQQIKSEKIVADKKGKQAYNWFAFVQEKPFK